MASNMSLPGFQGPLLKSKFLGRTDLSNLAPKSSFTAHRRPSTLYLRRPYAKFNLSEILGGRGLLNGERGVEKELTRNVQEQSPAAVADETEEKEKSESGIDSAQEAAFNKELMGLAGGFPGGEKGLRKFIEKNPPPKRRL